MAGASGSGHRPAMHRRQLDNGAGIGANTRQRQRAGLQMACGPVSPHSRQLYGNARSRTRASTGQRRGDILIQRAQ